MTTPTHTTLEGLSSLGLPLLAFSGLFYVLAIVAFFKKRQRTRAERQPPPRTTPHP